MCKQNKLEMAGQKKFSLREAVDPEATTDIRALFYTPIGIQDGWCFGNVLVWKQTFLYLWKSIKKVSSCEQNMAGQPERGSWSC